MSNQIQLVADVWMPLRKLAVAFLKPEIIPVLDKLPGLDVLLQENPAVAFRSSLS